MRRIACVYRLAFSKRGGLVYYHKFRSIKQACNAPLHAKKTYDIAVLVYRGKVLDPYWAMGQEIDYHLVHRHAGVSDYERSEDFFFIG